ncbi:MAG TPA: HK97 family phage prohead protease [Microthrixaceae bacterium]|nr:HK97 family phage prohead protease [Microthrixaceae bacterium]
MNARGPVEIRSATVDQVDYPDRVLSLIVAPFDEWAIVEHNGRAIEETISRGAFGAIRNRARKFKVNLEHDPDRWVGTVLDLDPDDPRGLVGTVKIRRNPEGDQALNDAADGLLGASIGMAVAPGDETITDGRRVITKAYLDHVALTATPAYVGAEVLEVRSAAPPVVVEPVTSATPNLDRVLAERREREYRSQLT